MENNLDSILVLKELQEMVEMFGASLYNSEQGFTQDQLYTYGGRVDSVFNLTLRPGSDMYQKYGEMVTVCFVYTLKERKALEENANALNNKPLANATLLDSDHDQEASDTLLKEGIDPHDITSIIVRPPIKENNTFPSKEMRKPEVLEIPFEAESNGRDIGWIYGFMKRLKAEEVGFMPEDEAQYLAYKLILEKEKLTKEEKKAIFDDAGRICNNAVSYYYLHWRDDAGILSDEQRIQLNTLELNRFCDRTRMIEKTLDNIGLNFEKFIKEYPKQADFLTQKIVDFRDISFNTTGKFPLFLNFESFLHIYFRHVEEFNISSQFAERDKFQLEEKDVVTVINIVMRDLNDEYQTYKEKNPNGRFSRNNEMAYYYNGDYYNVIVNPDGSINTFYKGTGKNKKAL